MSSANVDTVALRGLGARRLRLGGVGAPRDRVRDRRRALTRELDPARRDVKGLPRGGAGLLSGHRRRGGRYRELDDERVLVLYRRSGRGKTSGLELGQIRSKGAVLFHARGGKVTRLVFYWDRERALADLGLAAQAGARDDIGEP